MQAAKAQLAQKAFRATITGEDGSKASKTVLEFVAPDRFHIIPSAGQEIIILKDATYMKQGDKWIKSPINMGEMMSGLLNQQNIEAMLKEMDVADLKFVGADTVNGKPMWVYQHTTSMKAGDQTIKSQGKSWLGITDKLVYKIESEADSLVNKGSKTKTTVLYDYDPNIKIEAPIQ